MSRCVHHPGRPSVAVIYQQNYCTDCQRGIFGARARVDRHVVPRDCFVWYRRANDWQPIIGTGCAHWVAHQRGIQRGGANEQCLAAYPYRVRTLIQGLTAVPIANIQVDDIYVTPAVEHTGLVIAVTPNAQPAQPPTITIRHDSSGQGGVVDSDFAGHFHGQGTFYR